MTIYRGQVVFRSMGPESDAWIQALDQEYGTKLGPRKMAREVRWTALSLAGDPRNLDAGPVKIKIFFETGAEADYAEAFLDVDAASRSVQIREKDESYRAPLVRALREP
jgi:hypothetical protein